MKTTRTFPRVPPPYFWIIGTILLIPVFMLSTRAVLAQCPPSPTTYTNGAIEGLVANGLAAESAVAAQGEGKFIVIYAKPVGAPGVNAIYVHRFFADGACICETRDPGTSLDDDYCPALLTITDGVGRGIHQRPSIAMNRGADGRAEWFATWTGLPIGAFSDISQIILTTPGPEAFQSAVPFRPAQTGTGPSWIAGEDRASAGIGETVPFQGEPWAYTWANQNRPDCTFLPVEQRGLMFTTAFQVFPCYFQIEPCTPAAYCDNRQRNWLPCTWMRDNGDFVAARGLPEDDVIQPPYDIRLHQYEPEGVSIGATAGITVNDPTIEQVPSFQSSPAVALVGDQIVVTWTGLNPAGCEPIARQIFARRYQWNPFGDPTPIGEQFIVNSDPAWLPVSETAAHPTVAIRNAPGVGPNHFAILWNVKNPTNTAREIHA